VFPFKFFWIPATTQQIEDDKHGVESWGQGPTWSLSLNLVHDPNHLDDRAQLNPSTGVVGSLFDNPILLAG